MKRQNDDNRLTKLAYQKPTSSVVTIEALRLMAGSYVKSLGNPDDENEITDSNDII